MIIANTIGYDIDRTDWSLWVRCNETKHQLSVFESIDNESLSISVNFAMRGLRYENEAFTIPDLLALDYRFLLQPPPPPPHSDSLNSVVSPNPCSSVIRPRSSLIHARALLPLNSAARNLYQHSCKK